MLIERAGVSDYYGKCQLYRHGFQHHTNAVLGVIFEVEESAPILWIPKLSDTVLPTLQVHSNRMKPYPKNDRPHIGKQLPDGLVYRRRS